jgi:hypothetical protein
MFFDRCRYPPASSAALCVVRDFPSSNEPCLHSRRRKGTKSRVQKIKMKSEGKQLEKSFVLLRRNGLHPATLQTGR